MSSSRLLPLLHCPLCPPNSPLVSPVTLRCGHTVCAAHLDPEINECPLPVCPPPIPDAMAGLRIPADSNVIYHPAVIPENAVPDTGNLGADHGADVTVNKLVGIVTHYHNQTSRTTAVTAPESDADDDDDDEPPARAHTPARRSHSRPSTGSDSSHNSSRRPAKRRKRHAESQRQPSPEFSDESSRFDKELLTELTCEICFMLYYQPVTTPCQHVCILSFFHHCRMAHLQFYL